MPLDSTSTSSHSEWAALRTVAAVASAAARLAMSQRYSALASSPQMGVGFDAASPALLMQAWKSVCGP